MANQRRDIVFPQPYTKNGEQKIFWQKVGNLWHNAETGNITIDLDLMPIPTLGKDKEGNLKINKTMMAFKPKPKEGSQPPTIDVNEEKTVEVQASDIPF